MELTILPKGEKLQLDIEAKEKGKKVFYFGAGWDAPEDGVDVDVVAVALRGGKKPEQTDLAFYNQKTRPGIQLSEDNRTGEGEGDDEHVIINLDELADGVDEVAVGLICYTDKSDFQKVPNPHFRVCDGDNAEAPQMADIKVSEAGPGDTVLLGFRINRETGELTNVGEFHKGGNGAGAVEAFASLFA